MRRVGAGSTHEAVAAQWDGRTWSEVVGVDDAQLFDVVADRAGEGLAVGRTGRDAVIARACLRRPSTGAIEPGSDTRSQPETAAAGGGPSPAIDEERLEAGLDGPEDDPVTRPPVAGPARVTPVGRRLHALRRLPRPRRSTTILARDVASRVGLAGRTSTSGAIVADFDGDGRDDLFVGQDGSAGAASPRARRLVRGARAQGLLRRRPPRLRGCGRRWERATGPLLRCRRGARRGTEGQRAVARSGWPDAPRGRVIRGGERPDRAWPSDGVPAQRTGRDRRPRRDERARPRRWLALAQPGLPDLRRRGVHRAARGGLRDASRRAGVTVGRRR